jgi:hypothetical protein
MIKSIKIILFWCFLLSTATSNMLVAQVGCGGSVPHYTIDLTGNPDSSWSSPAVSRSGQCCSVSNPDRCIWFTVTLDPNAQGVTVTVSGGTGTTDYSIGCSTPTPVGDTICLSGVGPHEITVCKPGNNAQVYTIHSVPNPGLLEDTVLISPSCGKNLIVSGLLESSITWQSLNNDSLHNTYLSCASGCDSTTINIPSSGYPAYVDYIVSGYGASLTCDTSRFYDTVRVFMYSNPEVDILQDTIFICYGTTNTNATATPSGGLSPYQLLWSTTDTSSSVTLTPGIHWVRVTDSLGCENGYDTVVVSQLPQNLADAGNDTSICSAANAVYLNGSITTASGGVWTGRGGHFIDDDSTNLNATYIPSYDEVQQGSTFLVLTSTGNNGCDTAVDTVNITIYNAPVPIINGDIKICEGAQNVSYSVTPSTNHTYDWHVVGGTIASGQNTDEVKVDWGNSGPGYIYMVQTDSNGCQGVGAINTISRFDFNSHPLTKATIGPDATDHDDDAYSNGFGYLITDNCGGGKGIDLEIPGSVFDRGKICMTYSWQRDENVADFFNRGGIKFRIRSGQLQIALRIEDGNGGYTDIGPLNTGYSVPNDNIHRYFTFCYDSATGVGVAMQFDSVVWTYNGTPGRSLYWNGAGDATIGEVMDGSCNGRTLLDWSNISIPITIIPKPSADITGINKVCQHESGDYEITDTSSYYKYNWTVDGGTITNGLNTYKINVRWDSVGDHTINVVLTDSINGCDTTLTYEVEVNAIPPTQISGEDSVCQNIENIFTAPVDSNYSYQWTASTGTFTGSTTNDSAYITFMQGGTHTISLTITDTVTGCDSTISYNVFVDSLPIDTVSGNNPVCEGSTGNIYLTTNNSLYTYTWTVNGGKIDSGAGTNSISVTWLTPGVANMKLVIEKAPLGCSKEIQYPVTVLPQPTLGPIQHH